METEFRHRADDSVLIDSFECMDFIGALIIHAYRPYLLDIMIYMLLTCVLSSPPMDMGHAWQRPAFVASSQLLRLHFINNINVVASTLYQAVSI